MEFFGFWRKLDASQEYSLGEIPLFSALTASQQRMIESKARLVEYKRGDLVYREGDPAEGFFIVIYGRFRLFNEAKANFPERTLLYCYRGDHFGETSLLTDQPHSASVAAKSDGLVLKLDKDDFLELVNHIPNLSLHLSRSLGHRLTRTEDEEGHHEVKTIALYAATEGEEALRLWIDFAEQIFKVTKKKVAFIDFVSPPHELVKGYFKNTAVPSFDLSTMEVTNESGLKEMLLEHESGSCYLHVRCEGGYEDREKKIRKLIGLLTCQFHYLLLRLPYQMSHVAFRVLRQSDMVYAYCEPEVPKIEECAQAVNEFREGFGFSKNEIRVIIPDEPGAHILSEAKLEEILGVKIFCFLASRTRMPARYESSVHYFAKELSGNLIGLVLGSGAAYGLAHIGVLKVLEREGIRVDVIAGASIGAMIGTLWAAGYSADNIAQIAGSLDKRTSFFKLVGFRDLTFAFRGFLRGNQLVRFLRSYLGEKTFQDLSIPVKVIATDLITSEEVVFDTGRVVEAVRASVSIPGIFRPARLKGRYLIDGGVIDPLPVRVLSRMGVRKIIAVNVLCGAEDRKEYLRVQRDKIRRWLEENARRNRWSRWLSWWAHKFSNRFADNTFNAIMNTIQFMGYEMATMWGIQADVFIQAVRPGAHWVEFYSSDRFIQIGMEKTEEQLEEIKRLLVE